MAEETVHNPSNQPQVMTAHINITWHSDGRVTVDAPPHPLLVMKIMGDALDILSKEFTKMATEMVNKSNSPIIQPGLTAVDKRIVEAAKR